MKRLTLLLSVCVWVPTHAHARVAAVYAGALHTCARLADASVKCWGDNRYGQLGVGDTATRGDAPGEMGAALPFTNVRLTAQLALGSFHTCALDTLGDVRCWGNGTSGQLGYEDQVSRNGSTELPPIALGAGFVTQRIASGERHTCALSDAGKVKCWGDNRSGQLGYGDTAARGHAPNTMGDALNEVALPATALDLGAGGSHTCARLANNSVVCWGSNNFGQLGIGASGNIGDEMNEMGASLDPINLGTDFAVAGVTVGFAQTCALAQSGAIKCFGYNGDGRLGLGDVRNRGLSADDMGDALPPAYLAPQLPADALRCGERHCCARFVSHTLKCWGMNTSGQLGVGDTLNRGADPATMGNELPFAKLGRLYNVEQFAIGAFHTCAILDGGVLKCWGHNRSGQLGLGDTNNRGGVARDLGDNLAATVVE